MLRKEEQSKCLECTRNDNRPFYEKHNAVIFKYHISHNFPLIKQKKTTILRDSAYVSFISIK